MEPTDRDFKRRSKFLSKILRHKPEMVGVELDLQGWVDIDLLLDAMQARDIRYTREVLDEVVRLNNKNRFEVSEDGNGNRRGLGLSWAQGPVVHYLRDGCEVLPVGWVLWILGDPEGTLMIRMVETNLGDGKVCRQTITTRWWPWLDLSREWIGFRTIHEGTLRTDG